MMKNNSENLLDDIDQEIMFKKNRRTNLRNVIILVVCLFVIETPIMIILNLPDLTITIALLGLNCTIVDTLSSQWRRKYPIK